MTDSVTPNKGYTLPTPGADEGTWPNILNENFSFIDTNIGGGIEVSITSGQLVLTSEQAANAFFKIIGTLTAAAQIAFPASASGFFFMANNTTGAFSLSVSVVGSSTEVAIPQETAGVFFIFGSNVVLVANST